MEAEEQRAAMLVIEIDYSGLKQIREDAAITRDSLLTEEEMEESREAENAGGPEMDSAVKKIQQSPGEADRDAGVKPKTGADSLYRRILLMLLDGQPINDVVRENHLMPAVVADAINEAFFDEIGDSVVECDGDEIRVVEDYREDMIQALGEISL